MGKSKFPREIRYLPPVFMFILTLIFVYLFIKQCFLTLINQNFTIIVVLIWSIFSLALVMWLWGFFSIMFGDPGSIENEKKYCPEGICNVKCMTCKSYKPFRTHHCSTCGKCYARLDHHCLAFGKCIALRNHKTFLVFLFYSAILCFLWCITTVITMILCKFDEMPRVLFVHLFASVTMSFLIFFLLREEICSLMKGETSFEKIFDIHFKQNKTKKEFIEEIMGPFGIEWFIPTPTPTTTTAYQWENLRNTVI